MFERFCDVRKTLLWNAKKIHSAIRPMTTGSARRSVASNSPNERRRAGGKDLDTTGAEGWLIVEDIDRPSACEIDALISTHHRVDDLFTRHVFRLEGGHVGTEAHHFDAVC